MQYSGSTTTRTVLRDTEPEHQLQEDDRATCSPNSGNRDGYHGRKSSHERTTKDAARQIALRPSQTSAATRRPRTSNACASRVDADRRRPGHRIDFSCAGERLR
ncbi:hypothetical protein EVG20_g10435 [Dentipellis fragilis]|uniref:Uncharacterized protein n=1 Tax=Dentipellis fragilis TaxID=205917 RepID=A0A4Y9XUA1_9AGAM|nr:hypothetical protein EVG20_g10435 [Dentipellis fragilis]